MNENIWDEIFCFAHIRWCHNRWASNILIVVMPIHYDTIEDGQNKKFHLLFCKYYKWLFDETQIITFLFFFTSIETLLTAELNLSLHSSSPSINIIEGAI